MSRPPPRPEAARQPYLWLTTTGRSSGKPRTVELWFSLDGSRVHMLAGGGERTHWVQNALVHPLVSLHLDGTDYAGTARAPEPGSVEDDALRRALAAKYQGWQEGRPLSRWATSSFAMAVDLEIARDTAG